MRVRKYVVIRRKKSNHLFDETCTEFIQEETHGRETVQRFQTAQHPHHHSQLRQNSDLEQFHAFHEVAFGHQAAACRLGQNEPKAERKEWKKGNDDGG